MGLGLAVALAGGLGTLTRYGVHLVMRRQGWPVPAGTFAVNIVGSLLVGFMLVRFTGHPWIRLVGGLGFLGGFTTFSTLALELHSLAESRALGTAVAYGAGTLIAGLAAVYVGVLLARV
jgi:fluoride exporter